MADDKPVNLTFKRRKWLDLYLEEEGNATEAAMQAYDCKDRKSAAAIGSQNLRMLKGTLADLMDLAGLTDAKLMLKLSDGLDAMKTEIAKHDGKLGQMQDFIDYPTRRAYLEMGLKMRGMLKDIIKHEGRLPKFTSDMSPEEYIEAAISQK